jgi:antitoxin ParD1/3/4
MPIRNVAPTARLNALRKAIRVGLDDLEAGRYKRFTSFADLDRYLDKLTDRVLAKRRVNRVRIRPEIRESRKGRRSL